MTRRRGFSTTGLILIIIGIGIVVALIFNSLGEVEAKKRDEGRKQKINAIAAALETCFENTCKKSYPHVGELQDDSAGGWLKVHLPNLPQAHLLDFKSVKIQENHPTVHSELQYDPRTADDKPCSLYTDTCTSFILRAFQETDMQNPYVKTSLPRELNR